MHGQYIISMDRQLIGGEDALLWLQRGDLRGETDSEIIAAQDQALQTIIMRQKYYKQQQITNADSVNSLMRQWNTSYQHSQYRQKNSTQRDMTECVISDTLHQRYPIFLTRGALFRINFYGGAPCLPYVLQVNGVQDQCYGGEEGIGSKGM